MKFKEGDNIIAIRDAQLPIKPLPKGLTRAYVKGDKFSVYRESLEDSSGFRLIVWHKDLGELEVNPDNFEIIQ